MSNIFLKDNLNTIFTETEANISLPTHITVIDRANNTQKGGSRKGNQGCNFSATSSANMTQLGGNMSMTSNVSVNNNDVNKLVSMLTSESSSNVNGLSETSTVSLENQLREILGQNGGSNKSVRQNGGSGVTPDSIKKFFYELKNQGVSVDVKLNNKSMSEFFDLADDTTTELVGGGNSEISSVNINNILGIPNGHDNEEHEDELLGGARKSKKSSKKSRAQDGGVNPGFQAFLDLKKFIAEKLKISNGPQAAEVAGAVQKEMKEKHPDLDAVKIAEEGRKHFEKNIEHFRQMLK